MAKQHTIAKKTTAKMAAWKSAAVWSAIFALLGLLLSVASNLLAEQVAEQLKDAKWFSFGMALFVALIAIAVAVWEHKRELELEEIKRLRARVPGGLTDQISPVEKAQSQEERA